MTAWVCWQDHVTASYIWRGMVRGADHAWTALYRNRMWNTPWAGSGPCFLPDVGGLFRRVRRLNTVGPHTEQIAENSECSPNTEYGKAKLAFYEKLSASCAKAGISYKEPRFFSLYGPDDYTGTMILSILRDMLANRPCRLSECRQMWDYLYIDDAIEGLIRLCKEPCPDGVYILAAEMPGRCGNT